MSVQALADLLHETSVRHGHYEATHQPHDWWDWYAAYMMHARAAASPTPRPPAPIATWRRSATYSPADFARIDALSAHMGLWMLRTLHLHWHRR